MPQVRNRFHFYIVGFGMVVKRKLLPTVSSITQTMLRFLGACPSEPQVEAILYQGVPKSEMSVPPVQLLTPGG